MTRHQITIVLDTYLTLDGRCRQVTDLGNTGAGKTDQTAQQQYIYIIHGMCFVDPHTVQQTQYDGCDDTANGTFNSLFRTQYRAQFLFTKEKACKVCTCITAKGRDKCQPNKQFTMVIFMEVDLITVFQNMKA